MGKEILGSIELNRIYQIDCVEGMKLLPDNCVDLVVTSPPYDSIRDYKKNEWQLDLPAVGKQVSRILKDGGMAVMVIQDQTKDGRKSGTSFRTIVNWIDNTELDLWECCIYERSGTPGAWWNKRFRVDHEYMPIFIKGKRPQYFDKEHMKIKSRDGGKTTISNNRNTDGNIYKSKNKIIVNEYKCCGTIMMYPNSNREMNNNPNKEQEKIKLQHPATFPDKLASDLIQAFTKENMIVLDPFMGSGTTAVMANINNRKWIGYETSQEYIEIANIRLNNMKLE